MTPLAVLAPVLAFFAPAAFAQGSPGGLRLPRLFSGGMVLQRETHAPIWGWAKPGAAIEVRASFLAEPVRATAGADGRWSALLHTPEAGGPHWVIAAGDGEVRIDDVLVGEVWLASGQSNMEMTLGDNEPGYKEVKGAREAIPAADLPRIRVFEVPNRLEAAPAEDCEGSWVACSPRTAPRFSAAAFFFARELERELGVPIGVITADWGGTACEAWTSAEGLAGFPELQEAVAEVQAFARDPDGIERANREALDAWWRKVAEKEAAAGAGDWASTAFDDSSWERMTLPATWSGKPLGTWDGTVLFRRGVEIPAAWVGRDLALELGPIDDVDVTFFGGVKVGATEQHGLWREPRRYTVPASLVRAGPAAVAVRVLDLAGLGGINGEAAQMKLFPAGGGGDPLALGGEWRWRRGVALADLGRPAEQRGLHPRMPCVLYNGMIAPLAPFAIRGAIWYQGESNRERPLQYRTLFPNMIAHWRERWGRGDFPFYFVQIAPFAYEGDRGEAALLREAQMLALATPATGMVVTLDVGDPQDIHPADKETVGVRLSLWALSRAYGREGVSCSGPLYRAMKAEPGLVRLSFTHADGGLVSRDGPLECFQVAGADRVFHAADAAVEGDTVVVSCAAVAAPVAVRFAWGAADQPNLFNGAGLPASSFRTDAW